MVDVTLPSLGESVTEGIITRWFKHVGDSVARDEPLFEVSTDKVDSEMPSPAAGVLTEVLAEEGDTVETGARVAVIDDATSAPSAPVASAPTPPASVSTPAPTAAAPAPATPTPVPPAAPAPTPPASVSTPAPTPPASVSTPVPTPAPTPPASVSTPVPTPAPSSTEAEGSGGLVLSPVVRRILADGGVDATTIQGTGPGGSITRRDAERAVANGPTDDVVVPLSNGRRRMGHHMSESSHVAPHGFVAVEVDGAVFADLEALGRATRDGVAVSDEMVVGLAAVRALGEFDFLNATFAGDELVVHRTVNLGFVRAAAADGMLVPVVHAAAGLTLRALARRVVELGERVASRQLTADDLMGGTFTIVGAPSVHTLWTQPIIIQPQVAVLSVGAVREVPVVVRDDEGTRIVPGRRLVLGLSFDHRVCEPVTAVGYLERVGELLAGMDLASEH